DFLISLAIAAQILNVILTGLFVPRLFSRPKVTGALSAAKVPKIRARGSVNCHSFCRYIQD
ncbi:MAG: hypothetical protein ACI9IN_002141, partial [Porticoccaceae bacterium]